MGIEKNILLTMASGDLQKTFEEMRDNFVCRNLKS